jgi:hypothetical protein
MNCFFTIKRKSLECIPKSHPKFSAQGRSIFFQVASTAKRKLQYISERERERERDQQLISELQNFNRETKSIWQGRRKKKSPTQKSSSGNTKDAGWPYFVEGKKGTHNKQTSWVLLRHLN